MANPNDTKAPKAKETNGAEVKPAAPAMPAASLTPAVDKQPALPFSLPVPDTSLDLSAEATKRLEEYKAGIFGQALQDKLQAAFSNPDMTVAGFAGLCQALLTANGKPALDAMNALKVSDLLPKGKEKDPDGKVYPREKAADLTAEQLAALKLKVLALDFKEGLFIGQIAKLAEVNSPTARLAVDPLKAEGKLFSNGTSRATTYTTTKPAPVEPAK